MENPFRKTAGDRAQEVNRLAREQAERDKRQEEKKREYEIREAVKQARKEEIRSTREEALHQKQLERARTAPDRRERIEAAGQKVGRVFDNLQKLDKSRPKSRSIRYTKKKGRTVVYVQGESPVQQQGAFDNRFAGLFEINSPVHAGSGRGTGRDFGKLTDTRFAFGKRRNLFR